MLNADGYRFRLVSFVAEQFKAVAAMKFVFANLPPSGVGVQV